MAFFPGHTEDYWMEELTGAKTWIYYNFAVENQNSFWGETVKRDGRGYVGQEYERLKDGR